MRVARHLIALLLAVLAGTPLASAQDAPAEHPQPGGAPHDHTGGSEREPARDAAGDLPRPSVQHEHPAPRQDAVRQHDGEHATETVLFSPRDSSGTAWLPDVTPMYGLHGRWAGWDVMLHGNAFLQLLHEAAPEHRGATQAGSINWVMLMARRLVGTSRIGARAMVSLEPWTISGCGYPNLLATGEICDGDSIHDRQHPHDLFMEIAAEHDRPLSAGLRWQVYGGLAGEPALGPVAFPHRVSAMPNPLSPVSHHWIDATHITFGVITTGVYTARWKIEGSVFNGREPDERRHDLDLGRLDSVSARMAWMPAPGLAMQLSGGHLREGEASHTGGPPIDLTRVTGSAILHRVLAGGGLWASTLSWGANRESGSVTHGLVAESSVSTPAGHAWFGRLEMNGKPGHDLHVHELPNEIFTVGKLQAGYTRYFSGTRPFVPGIGGSVSAAIVPPALRPRYGGVGFGVAVFATVRPAAHDMSR